MNRNRTETRPVFRNVADLQKKEDRRVRRTRDKLGDALVELLVQKPFDEITVQDVLDRAGVSRSTFYSHFSDKNDLFFSDSDEFLEGMATALSRFGDKSERVAPVQELFAHIARSASVLQRARSSRVKFRMCGNWVANISRAASSNGFPKSRALAAFGPIAALLLRMDSRAIYSRCCHGGFSTE